MMNATCYILIWLVINVTDICQQQDIKLTATKSDGQLLELHPSQLQYKKILMSSRQARAIE